MGVHGVCSVADFVLCLCWRLCVFLMTAACSFSLLCGRPQGELLSIPYVCYRLFIVGLHLQIRKTLLLLLCIREHDGGVTAWWACGGQTPLWD